MTAADLPEGNAGIAAHYPGDAGIASDKSVIFAEDFESPAGALAMLFNWSGVSHFGNVRITTTESERYTGQRGLELVIPRQNEELSTGLYKRVYPERDVLFLRFYAKFDGAFDVTGSSHNGASISAHYCCPGVRSNGYNKFSVSYETWRDHDDIANPGALNAYIYHPDQRDVWGDHWYPDGTITPNSSIPNTFGAAFVARPNIIPQLNKWYCYEFMVKANTPGVRDGRVALWLDGRLIADFPNLRLRDSDAIKIDRFSIDLHVRNNTRGIAKRWYDNIVAATTYIGPIQPR